MANISYVYLNVIIYVLDPDEVNASLILYPPRMRVIPYINVMVLFRIASQ